MSEKSNIKDNRKFWTSSIINLFGKAIVCKVYKLRIFILKKIQRMLLLVDSIFIWLKMPT